MGLSARYIYSNLTGAFSGIDAKPGHSVAVDIGAFYTTELEDGKTFHPIARRNHYKHRRKTFIY